MKNFKVQVDTNKAEFFKELMDSLNFVYYNEVDSFTEARVYPAADFTLGATKETRNASDEAKKNAPMSDVDSVKSRRDSLEDIRNAMSKIEKLRGR